MLALSGVAAAEPTHLTWRMLTEGLISGGNARTSWLDGGAGKFRAGAEQNDAQLHAAFGLEYRFNLQSAFKFEGAYHGDNKAKVGLTQAYWEYKPLASQHWRSQYRVGAFHVPASLENHGDFWYSPYNQTSSLLNSWIGEELRTIGLEGRWQWRASPQSPHKFSVSAAIFAANDSAGAMLSWRGWAAHNRQTLIGERLSLRLRPSIQEDGVFPDQAPEFEPFVEVDDRLGYYISVDWLHHSRFHFRYFYYDNRGDPLALENGQYAWGTNFQNIGARLNLSPTTKLIAQWMHGNTTMGPGAIDNDYSSAFVLLSHQRAHHRLTFRAERFSVNDNDFMQTLDPNDENGDRLTFSYVYRPKHRLSIAVEASRIRSDRADRVLFDESPRLVEHQVNTRIRYRFRR